MVFAGFTVWMFLDPSLCNNNDRLTNFWVSLSWTAFSLLNQPGLYLPILFILAIAPWLVRPLRRLKSVSYISGLILAIYFIVNTPIFVNLSGRSFAHLVPHDTGEIADAIVILGRGGDLRPQRVEVALDLWHHQRAGLIFASGRGDGEKIVQALEQRGVPQSAVDGESCSRTTEENAEFTAALLKPKGVHKIILITDPPHMLRSLLTFKSFGFQVIPHFSEIPPSMAAGRLRFLHVREWIGLLGYGVRGRYFPRTG